MKLNKKLWWMMTLVALLLITMLVLPACAGTKVTEWRFQTIEAGPGSEAVDMTVAMWKKVEARSEGRFKLTPHYGMELGYQAKEYISVLGQGLLESADCPLGSIAFDYPWLGADEMPFLVFSPEERAVVSDATKPFIDETFRANGVLPLTHYFRTGGNAYGFTNKKLQTIADYKGLKVRVWNPEQATVMKEIGAAPLFVPMSEIYLALQRGTIDVVITGGTGGYGAKLYEVAKYAIPQWAMVVHCVLGVSQKAWDALPQDIQKIITEEATKVAAEIRAKAVDPKCIELEAQPLRDKGMEIVELPKATRDAMLPAAEVAQKAWLEKAGSKGAPMLEAMKKALAEHRKKK